ncbi:MAG: M42 family peptidase, partial [Oscillospiraceae bacterium]
MLSNLEMLSNLRGISGNEEKVRNAILELIKDNATTVTVDNLGDLIVFKKGKKTPSKKVLFSAHIDEVGFIVTQICEDGCLMFEPVGGVQTGVTLGKKVLIGEDK